ncbi:MAG: DUF3570 domain-containing protein [Nitrospirae bacterium]|nr:DUF3570 domain-containing protein [Nitrospirota bacterium]MBI5097266.1 DUF3570 domain-containing protein [Nitrospirota bacterium]
MAATDVLTLKKGVAFLSASLTPVFTGMVLLFTIFSMPAAAENYATDQFYIHSFDNNVTVYTNVFSLNKDLNLETSVNFKYTVDLINPSLFEGGGGGGTEAGRLAIDKVVAKVAAISSASTAASGSGSSSGGDTRNELTAGISHNFGNLITVDAYYDYSSESDYTSQTPAITFKKELFEKNTTLTAGYSRNMDRVDGQFMGGAQDRNTNNFYAGITQLFSPVTIGQIGYSRNQSTGFQSEGVRLVPVDGALASSCTAESVTCVDEVFPDSRTRYAYLAGVSHYFIEGLNGLLDRSSIKLNLRYYHDDWDITSYTGEVEYNKYLSEELFFRFSYRYYTQSKAFFIKDAYLSSDLYKSSSPQLFKLDSNLAGFKLTYLFKDSPAIDDFFGLQLHSLEGKYEYYTESIGVTAHSVMAGVKFLF